MNESELLSVVGGISGTFINSLVRGINALMELGKSFGSALRMFLNGTKCPI
jgi:hypothetical protein